MFQDYEEENEQNVAVKSKFVDHGVRIPAVFIGRLTKAPPTPVTKVKEQWWFFSSRLLVKSVKDLRAEATKYDQLLQYVRQAAFLSRLLTAWRNRCPF